MAAPGHLKIKILPQARNRQSQLQIKLRVLLDHHIILVKTVIKIHIKIPHPLIFDAYRRLLESLAQAEVESHRPLRLFEKRLLDELGWGLNLEHEATSGKPLLPGRSYRYGIEGGAEPVDGVAEGSLIFCGASLLALAREELDDPRSLADARRLLRAALDRLLDGRPLRTREVLLEMRAHAGKADGG